MASIIDMKEVVKHISNGTLADSLCRICLKPLGKQAESVFTKICKEDYDYCVADILKNICDIEVPSNEHHQVCPKCFVLASLSYKFYLLSKQTDDILNFYADELLRNIDNIDIIVPQNITSESLCIPLPMINPIDEYYSFDIDQISRKLMHPEDDFDDGSSSDVMTKTIKVEKNDSKTVKSEFVDNDEHVVMVMDENGEACYFRPAADGNLVQMSESEVQAYNKMLNIAHDDSSVLSGKKKRKRKPVLKARTCMFCPASFKFVTKLQHHMKQEHSVDMFLCKICKKTIVGERSYNDHLFHHHKNVLRCDYCGLVLKKRNVMISHIKNHLTLDMMSRQNKVHVCETCGAVFVSEEELKDHNEQKHEKRHTCFYCGRQYKGLISLEAHIRKHEKYLNCDASQPIQPVRREARRDSRHACAECGRAFVDARALMWHTRLHTNERPFICEVCGRGFVSSSRRAQHALCSHSAPRRRCPLCPAAFHLASMVNTHIKKVHFRGNKKRSRASGRGGRGAAAGAEGGTEPVPVAELSVELQARILDLQNSQAVKIER